MSEKKERIGFVGIGLMGRALAENLLKAGHPLCFYVNRNRKGVETLTSLGAVEAENLIKLAENSDVIMLCVNDANTVRQVVGSMWDGLREGHLIIDATTSHPVVTKDLANLLVKREVSFVDAPVTGGPPQAEAGVLGSLVGCPETLFPKVKEIVSAYSKTVQRMGEVGSGNYSKLLNNFVTQGTTALLIEAYQRARDKGVNWDALYTVMQAGAARSGSLEKMVGPALEGNYEGGRFSIRNAYKDLDYFCDLAESSERGPSDLGNHVRKHLARAMDAGLGEHFVSALLDPEFDVKKRQ